MAVERNYYTIDPEGKLTCNKCKVPLVKGKAKFMYLENGFPVEMPVCPKYSSGQSCSLWLTR